MGDIPAVFPLCAIGRQFKNAVLQYDAGAYDDIDAGTSRSFEGATDDDGRSFQSQMDGGSWQGVAGRNVKKGLISVRRLTEEQGDGNEAVRGTLSDCYWGELTDLVSHNSTRTTQDMHDQVMTAWLMPIWYCPLSRVENQLWLWGHV